MRLTRCSGGDVRRCVTCNSIYGDDVRFCDTDGTPLLSVEALAPPPAARVSRDALKTWGAAAAFIGLIAAAGFAAISLLGPAPTPPSTGEQVGRVAVGVGTQNAPPPAAATPRPSPSPPSDWLSALFGPSATPSPTPPEMTPSPTASPTPAATSTGPAGRAEEPEPAQGGGEASGPGSTMTVISFGDGTSLEVDDVWRDEQGVTWYRRGGLMARIEGKRIKAISRPPAAEGKPSPTPPQPTPEPQESPEASPTPAPELRD